VLQTARDPILFKGGQANLFSYIGNDSVNIVDRAGIWSLAFNADFHVPPLPGYASAGLNVASETSVVTMKTGQIVCYKTGQIISSLHGKQLDIANLFIKE
jgi:hypothetical protein